MTKEEIQARARELYTLASKCQVPMLRACRRIKMATSTPHRWLNNGSVPDEGQMDALRASILRTADKHGTLPEQHRVELDALGDEPSTVHRQPSEIIRDLSRGMAELEQALNG